MPSQGYTFQVFVFKGFFVYEWGGMKEGKGGCIWFFFQHLIK